MTLSASTVSAEFDSGGNSFNQPSGPVQPSANATMDADKKPLNKTSLNRKKALGSLATAAGI
jgi:hypothetical protein